MLSQVSFVLALAASTTAHMIMADPLPFGRATLNSSPLAPADFPCKQRSGVYDIDLGMNQWNAGETKSVKFNGTAAHGGGSCQFSITTDSEPTKESQWKVIHSVEGNCLTSLPGNFPEIPGADPLMIRNATDIPVTMPSNIPDGRYTFAWSWLNKVGNREFYMNCAPIQVGSGAGKASTQSASQALSTLPDMFVANLPSKNTPAAAAGGLAICTTTEGQDFSYPNPGQSVQKGSGATLGSDVSGPGCAAQAVMGAGAGSIGSPSAGTPSTPTQPEASKPAASSAAPVKDQPQASKIPTYPGGGVFAPGASSAPAAVPTPQPNPPAAAPAPPAANPAPAAPQTPSTPQTGSGENTTTPSNGECTPCTNDGAVVCIGSKQFGLCNRGCAVAQDLAAGMMCQNGVVMGAAKRHIFPRAHLHRHFSAARLI